MVKGGASIVSAHFSAMEKKKKYEILLLFQQLAAIQKGFAYFNPDISPAAMYGILLGQWTNQGFFGPLF